MILFIPVNYIREYLSRSSLPGVVLRSPLTKIMFSHYGETGTKIGIIPYSRPKPPCYDDIAVTIISYLCPSV